MIATDRGSRMVATGSTTYTVMSAASDAITTARTSTHMSRVDTYRQ